MTPNESSAGPKPAVVAECVRDIREATMKTIAAAFATLCMIGMASAQTLEDLKNDGKNTDNILTYGMGYHQQRHSPLKQIDKTTVKRLVPVWNPSLDNQWGEQAQPI